MFLVPDDIAREWKSLKKQLPLYQMGKLYGLFDVIHDAGVTQGIKQAIDTSTSRRGRGIRKDATITKAVRLCEKWLDLPRGSVSIHGPSHKKNNFGKKDYIFASQSMAIESINE